MISQSAIVRNLIEVFRVDLKACLVIVLPGKIKTDEVILRLLFSFMINKESIKEHLVSVYFI